MLTRICSALLAFVLGIFVAAWSHGDLARASQSADFAIKSPLPRFGSLKADRVDLRNGPGSTFPVSWVFMRIGLPVEVVEEAGGWRHVRDADGTTGWVPGTLLSARRTAIVLARDFKAGGKAQRLADLRDGPNASARVLARVEAGMLVSVTTCDGTWCRIWVEGLSGHMPQNSLWGLYPGERIR